MYISQCDLCICGSIIYKGASTEDAVALFNYNNYAGLLCPIYASAFMAAAAYTEFVIKQHAGRGRVTCSVCTIGGDASGSSICNVAFVRMC
jgi:hypothetical protein